MRKNKKEPTVLCKTCGHENPISLDRCSVCDTDLTELKEELEEVATFEAPPDIINKPSVLLRILSFFIPLLGFILFLVKRKKEPKAAKSYLKCALISFILGLILGVIGYLYTIKFSVNLGEGLSMFGQNTEEQVSPDDFVMYEDSDIGPYDADYYVPPIE